MSVITEEQEKKTYQFTLMLSGELAAEIAILLKVVPPERIEIAAEAFADALDAQVPEEMRFDENAAPTLLTDAEVAKLPSGVLEDLQDSLMQYEAGEFIDGEEFLKQLRARFGTLKK